MKSLVLHFEDEEFQLMKDTKEALGETWEDLIPVSIAEYFFHTVLYKLEELKHD